LISQRKTCCTALEGIFVVLANIARTRRIRPELWLDDLVKGTELPTSCITLLKLEKEKFCGFLKNVKVPSD
jgi:hypothetical protein